MHETIAAEHGVEARRRERQGLCVAPAENAFGHQLAGKFDRCYGEIESNRLRAVLQPPAASMPGPQHISRTRVPRVTCAASTMPPPSGVRPRRRPKWLPRIFVSQPDSSKAENCWSNGIADRHRCHSTNIAQELASL